jgi:nucleoside-diphosphate-sugar epimerase
MSEPLHVIFGAGPVGTWTANALIERGLPVRLVSRSGRRPALLAQDAEVRSADLSDPAQAAAEASGAAVVYQALNPPYHRWHELFPGLQAAALAAAGKAGARYVSIDNLYMYDPSTGPIGEATRIAPRSRKGELRARMAAEVLAAHERGEVQAAILRSSDYYGPGVLGSALGERVFPPILAGKAGEALGALDVPHSYAYIEDVGRAAAELGLRDEAPGDVWITPHAPAVTQRDVIDGIFAAIGQPPRYRTVGRGALRFAGLFTAGAREMVEMMYEFTEPFVVDSSRIEDAFGLRATPLEEGVARTVAWYREHARARA